MPHARPHWAKGFQFMPNSTEYVKNAFAKQIQEFLAVRKASGVDPDNMFVNETLAACFMLN
ncbi:D-arabinono-1,4-lactone oxidase [Marinomonas sp. TI.3.20]|uniref:D-arabinono-1,4-lactone oxidase n=1 Tax=Marinomonas sp. TI.3.20 TaxID=3121296 RepID=UPI00312020B4